MTQTFKDILKHVVTYGDYGIAAAGQPLYTRVGRGDTAKLIYNVLPGQLVAYINDNGVLTTIDDSTLTASMLPNLFIGVGYAGDKTGLTTGIRHLGIEGISGCNPEKTSTSSPRCGGPVVKDFYFDCTKCDETYTVTIRIDDNKTRSFGPYNRSFAEYIGSVVTNCSSCDNCPVEHNCKEVACKLADSLNGVLDLKVGNQSYPDWKGKKLPRPYFVTRLHETSKVYCFAPQSTEGACENCTHFGAISGVTIRGTRYPFVGNTNPLDSTQTLYGQLESIKDQINDAFITEYAGVDATVNPHAGSAYITGTYQKCCSVQLHVNTCDATFELYDRNNDAIEPVTSNNPFAVYGTSTPEPNCIDCADAAVAATATLTLVGNAANADTVVVGSRTYTFETVLTNVNGNVLVGATAADSINNLIAAINLGSGAGTTYATATTANTQVTALDDAGTVIKFTAKATGTAANSFTHTTSISGATFSAFTGGAAAASSSPTVYNCGIRAIAEAIKGDCSCEIEMPLSFYGRKLDIVPVGEGWRGKPWLLATVQEMELPAGFGAWIQWLELQNTPEGTARRYGRSNYRSGWLQSLDPKSRANHAVTANCGLNYCSYFLQTEVRKRMLNNQYDWITVNSNLHIPSTHSNTIGDWEDFLTALLELNPQCKTLSATACDTELTSC